MPTTCQLKRAYILQVLGLVTDLHATGGLHPATRTQRPFSRWDLPVDGQG